MIIKYFSWIREHIGTSEEEIILPDSVSTIDDLINYLMIQMININLLF